MCVGASQIAPVLTVLTSLTPYTHTRTHTHSHTYTHTVAKRVFTRRQDGAQKTRAQSRTPACTDNFSKVIITVYLLYIVTTWSNFAEFEPGCTKAGA